MSSDNNDMPLPDPDVIDANAYHIVIGPVLQVAAEKAAQRGHPTLHDDLPVMLALIEIISQLADLYTETYPESAASATLADAPSSACVMVFREAELADSDIEACLRALATAHRAIHENEVLGDNRQAVAMAWSHFADDDRESARAKLAEYVATITDAVDAFEASRA